LLQLVPAQQPDPVAVYDIMRESATRLVSAYYTRANEHPVDGDTMKAMRAVRAEALAVPTDDIAAQLAATESFNDRREQVLHGE
jgi:hypothetical protein